jgi:hypothetical protein
VRADIRSFSDELNEGIRLDVCLPGCLFGFLNSFGFESEIGAEKTFEGVGRLILPSSTTFEPHTFLKGDSLFALAARTFIFLESGVFAGFHFGVEVCSQL